MTETVPKPLALWTNNRLKESLNPHGVVGEVGLEFSYNKSSSSGNVAIAIAKKGWGQTGVGARYFELTIIERGAEGSIAIGLIPEKYDVDSLPGWRENSIGYHADDAGVFNGAGSSEVKLLPIWCENGAVTGCGIDYESKTIFFTRQGNRLNRGYPIPNAPILYPAVGLRSTSEHARLNFGETPFVYEAGNEAAGEIW